jgi:uncharacterized membrane protein
MLLYITAVIFQWMLHIFIMRFVWNNVIVSLFKNSNINPIDFTTAACLLLLCRILFVHNINIPCNTTTPCERACIDACVGL